MAHPAPTAGMPVRTHACMWVMSDAAHTVTAGRQRIDVRARGAPPTEQRVVKEWSKMALRRSFELRLPTGRTCPMSYGWNCAPVLHAAPKKLGPILRRKSVHDELVSTFVELIAGGRLSCRPTCAMHSPASSPSRSSDAGRVETCRVTICLLGRWPTHPDLTVPNRTCWSNTPKCRNVSRPRRWRRPGWARGPAAVGQANATAAHGW
jgi:hypothetical protein